MISARTKSGYTCVVSSIGLLVLTYGVFSTFEIHSSAAGREYFVAPSGRSTNNGTAAAPLDLATALSQSSPAKPGDTIWLRGGTYRGAFISYISGQSGAPIVVRQYPNERATIDSAPSPKTALEVRGSWVTFQGFEIMNSDGKRTSSQSGSWPTDLARGHGIFTRAPNVKFINLVIHDTQEGIGLWSEAVDSEATGNIVYFNGWQAPDRAHGHGIYSQNRSGRRIIRDNIIFDQFSHGIHAYGSSAAFLDNMTLDGNVSFNNGSIGDATTRDILYGGGDVAQGMVVTNNYTLNAQTNIGYGAGCTSDAVFRNNFIVGPLKLINCVPGSLTGNVVYGNDARWSPVDGATLPAGNIVAPTRPTAGVNVFVRPNKYEAGRAHIVIYNWGRQPNVSVDLSGAGIPAYAAYEIRDAQNYFGSPIVRDSYVPGRAVTIPIGSLPPRAMPIGNVRRLPSNTAPLFGVFVVVPRGAAAPPPDPGPEPEGAVATPLVSPAGGTFTAQVTVSLATVTSGATIRYTLDGSTPTIASPAYGAPVSLTKSATLRARAFKSGSTDSGVASASFAINAGTASLPRDHVKPTISMTAPAMFSTVRGVIQVSAAASDNVGVTRVRFSYNGKQIGAIDQAAPYSVTWDTNTVHNASYRVLAEAWDAAGNRIEAAPRVVVVAN
jgi:hypothetical protein